MIDYNSQRDRLALPEYGRNIQQMVDYCLTIEDREQRTQCAYSIIQVMGNIVPQLRDDENSKHILWDHLAMMSDFKLDIDFPYEIIKEENLMTKPQPLKYKLEPVKMRHYGKTIENMVKVAAEMEDGEQKEFFILLLANHMKKILLSINKDGIEDDRVLKDLNILSNGKINHAPDTLKLHEFKEAPVKTENKKSSKKKK